MRDLRQTLEERDPRGELVKTRELFDDLARGVKGIGDESYHAAILELLERVGRLDWCFGEATCDFLDAHDKLEPDKHINIDDYFAIVKARYDAAHPAEEPQP